MYCIIMRLCVRVYTFSSSIKYKLFWKLDAGFYVFNNIFNKLFEMIIVAICNTLILTQSYKLSLHEKKKKCQSNDSKGYRNHTFFGGLSYSTAHSYYTQAQEIMIYTV